MWVTHWLYFCEWNLEFVRLSLFYCIFLHKSGVKTCSQLLSLRWCHYLFSSCPMCLCKSKWLPLCPKSKINRIYSIQSNFHLHCWFVWVYLLGSSSIMTLCLFWSTSLHPGTTTATQWSCWKSAIVFPSSDRLWKRTPAFFRKKSKASLR